MQKNQRETYQNKTAKPCSKELFKRSLGEGTGVRGMARITDTSEPTVLKWLLEGKNHIIPLSFGVKNFKSLLNTVVLHLAGEQLVVV